MEERMLLEQTARDLQDKFDTLAGQQDEVLKAWGNVMRKLEALNNDGQANGFAKGEWC